MTEQELVDGFESGTLGAEDFPDREHVRLTSSVMDVKRRRAGCSRGCARLWRAQASQINSMRL